MPAASKPEMDTGFCQNWVGDRKSKHCRVCAKQGTPCAELWEAVVALANQNFILTNPKNGNRYQLEPPKRSPMHIYIQTLQGKHAHFALPIEDLLYVAKTGRGGMYETPSRTKQEPFVGLILAKIQSAVSGEALVEAVKAIKTKSN